MALLAGAEAERVAAAWSAFPDKPEFRILRGPETGLVMVRGRTGGGGDAFNLGEATVTRATVRLATGEVGHAYASAATATRLCRPRCSMRCGRPSQRARSWKTRCSRRCAPRQQRPTRTARRDRCDARRLLHHGARRRLMSATLEGGFADPVLGAPARLPRHHGCAVAPGHRAADRVSVAAARTADQRNSRRWR